MNAPSALSRESPPISISVGAIASASLRVCPVTFVMRVYLRSPEACDSEPAQWLLALWLFDVDVATDRRAIGDGEAWRADVARDRSRSLDFDPLTRGYVTGHGALDDNGLGVEGGTDVGVTADRQRVPSMERHAAFHLAVEREIFGRAQIAFDDDRRSEIHD